MEWNSLTATFEQLKEHKKDLHTVLWNPCVVLTYSTVV